MLVDEPLALGLVKIELAVVGDVEPAQFRPGTFTHQLPGHQIGVVLHDGDDDLVAGAESGSEGVRGKVQRLGGVGEGDDLLGTVRPDELGDTLTSTLECLGGLQTQPVHRPGDIGVVLAVVLGDGIDDHLGFLGGVGRVEIGQRVAAHLPTENREIGPDGCDIGIGKAGRGPDIKTVSHQALAFAASTYFS